MYGAGGSHSKRTDYRVRITPEDGRAFESSFTAWGAFAEWTDMIAGYAVYVRYDRQMPEKCELDSEWYDEVRSNWPENAARAPEWLEARRDYRHSQEAIVAPEAARAGGSGQSAVVDLANRLHQK
jgi:hypothetical protein